MTAKGATDAKEFRSVSRVLPAGFFDVGESAAINVFSSFHSLHTAGGSYAARLFLVFIVCTQPRAAVPHGCSGFIVCTQPRAPPPRHAQHRRASGTPAAVPHVSIWLLTDSLPPAVHCPRLSITFTATFFSSASNGSLTAP